MKKDQAELSLGDELRDKGIARVKAKNPYYLGRFEKAAAEVLAEQGVITSESVMDKAGLPGWGVSMNVIGAAMRSFAVKNKLKVVGYAKSGRPTRHSGRIAIWGTDRWGIDK